MLKQSLSVKQKYGPPGTKYTLYSSLTVVFYTSCRPKPEECRFKKGKVLEQYCELEKIRTKSIDQRNVTHGIIHQINSPNYFSMREYPNNLYCMWNIANDGLVTYRIVDQQLQNATDCEEDGCDCPDFMKIKMGKNEIKLCGSSMPQLTNQISSDGLHVSFCSDSHNKSKGILVMAYRHKSLYNVMPLTPLGAVGDPDSQQQKKKRRQTSQVSLFSCHYWYTSCC